MEKNTKHELTEERVREIVCEEIRAMFSHLLGGPLPHPEDVHDPVAVIRLSAEPSISEIRQGG